MPCFSPLTAYRAVGGGVVFARGDSCSVTPLQLPCGQCVGCRAERVRQWAIRCVHEASCHERNSFITLTYSPQCVPADGGLVVKHWQDFAKRLRRRLGSFRFFHCGEYGEVNFRPHYHACIFGQDFSGDRTVVRDDGEYKTYLSPLLDSVWGKGFCTVGNLTYESAAYVARYVMKKATGAKSSEVYGRVDSETGEYFEVRPPYITMSRRPGIGSEWFDKFAGDVYPEDEVVYDGKRFRPPRFYDSKLPEDELEGLKAKRVREALRRSSELTPERLKARESVAERRLSLKERRL